MISLWPKKKLQVPLLITGHPRCGTTSAGEICRSLGLDVGDEGVGKDGACSWMFAVDDKWAPHASDELGRSRRNIRWNWLVFVVRDMRSAVQSVMLENAHAQGSFDYRRKHIRRQCGIDIASADDALSTAIWSIASWSRIILEQNPDIWFRVEDQQDQFRDFLRARLDSGKLQGPTSLVHVNADKAYGGVKREKPDVSAADWNGLSENTKRDVVWYCQTFGYAYPPGLQGV